MSNNKREFDSESSLRAKIMRGADVLADNVASTLGPRGRNVLLQEKGKTPFTTKDGVTCAQFVALDDPFENAAAQIIKQAAIQTNSDAGDGTTTSTVLARAILRESQKFISSGVSPVEIQRGINSAVEDVVSTLRAMARPVKSIADIEHIATISANNDGAIGKLISLAIDRVGQDGSITIEEARSMDTSVDITEGFRLDAGFSSSQFITDQRRFMMSHEEPYILVTDHKIDAVEPILPLLEKVAREGKPLIIVAEEIEGQALAALIMNALRGSLKVAAIKAPRYGEERRNILSDLAVSTGASFITRESSKKLQDVELADFGCAKYIESTKTGTVIVGGHADHEEVETRIESLKSEITATENLNECARIQERIVRLASGVAVIRVGGATEVEVTEKKHRIEDALEAVRSAQEEGIVSGGGVALLRASHTICATVDNSEQAYGINVVKSACEEPIRQMAMNAAISPDIIIEKILSESNDAMGWDFRESEMIDLMKQGVVDPVKVTRSALKNAASCAGTLITTNFGIIQTGDIE